MKWRNMAAGAMLLLGCSFANAAQDIGQAVTVKNDVRGQLDAVVRRLAAGTPVAADESVITGSASATLLRFLDNTQLNVGAASTVVLDRFVFNPNGGAKDAAINVSKGAMRFITGNSNPNNFVISTQVATIGIRGTDILVICDPAKGCALVVDKGVIGVCPKRNNVVPARAGRSCPGYFELNITNNFAFIDLNGTVTGPQTISQSAIQGAQAAIAGGQAINLAGLLLPAGTQFAALPGVTAGTLPVVGLVGVAFTIGVVATQNDGNNRPVTGNDGGEPPLGNQ
ncbi:FecR family protein [Ancylobacter terrae]|uniref:FecR family protein n=1 Tax=Ancylobacter sp. sgz301288 TaxID=3342077 RepID=UPI003858F9D2